MTTSDDADGPGEADELELQGRLVEARSAVAPTRREPAPVTELLRTTLARVGRRVVVPREVAPAFETPEDRWLRQAAARGCPQHRLTLAAARQPRDTGAVEILRKAVAWSAGLSRPRARQPFFVVLSGPPGRGKSVALAHAVAYSPRAARFVTAQAVATVPESDWSEFVEERVALLRVPFLAIDEAGMEHARRAGPRVSLLIHERYDQGLDTAVATNLSIDDFCARYFSPEATSLDALSPTSAKIRSRLWHEQTGAGLDPFWELPGPDLRQPGSFGS